MPFLRKTYRLIFSLPAFVVLVMCSFSAATAQLKANFSADTTDGCSPFTVQFTDQSTGNPTSWKWDFDDGRGSVSIQNPAREFDNPGTYTITLTVEDSITHETDTKKAYITVYDKPDVSFTVNPPSGCAPLKVHFTDQSRPGSGKIRSWLWDFGDGDHSTDANPVHTYKNEGPFDVKLVVTNTDGCSSFYTRTSAVTTPEKIQADFTADRTVFCSAPAMVHFNANTTSSQPVAYHWNFSDGGSANGTYPSYRFKKPGAYTVTLIASTPGGCPDTVVHQNFIHVASFHSDFTLPKGCTGVPLTFENTSPTPDFSVWHFDEGTNVSGFNATHQFKETGSHKITLINFYGGCEDSVTHTLNVFSPPEADFKMNTTESCSKPTMATFTSHSGDAIPLMWDFGDGLTSIESTPTHPYKESGTYTIKLIVKDKNGCTDPTQKIENINVLHPEINISADPSSGCVPLNVHFTSLISNAGPGIKYFWNFGDKDSSFVDDPVHKYTHTGTYDVSLRIKTSEGCVDTLIQKKFVDVVEPPKLKFSASSFSACLNTPITFTNLSNPPDANYEWGFPDDGIIIGATGNLVHQFSHLGKQDVILTANYKGCEVKLDSVGAIIIEPPEAVFSVSQSCNDPYTVTVTNESLQATGWHWDFGDNKHSDLQNPPPHQYATPGNYTITLSTKNGECTSDTSITVHIIDLHPVLKISSQEICRGAYTQFSLENTANVQWVQSYAWITGNGPIYTTGYPDIDFDYTNNGAYSAQLITTDLNGCKDTSALVPITVEGPTADFQLLSPNSCTGNKVTFKDKSTVSGAPIQKWNWDFGDGASENLVKDSVEHTYTRDGQYNVQLIVTDTNGCSDRILYPGIANVFSATADFSTPDTLTCPGSPITWINNSRGNDLVYQWNFGDSTVSNQEIPVKMYANEGIYPVSLKVKTIIGCKDSVLKKKYIRVVAPQAKWSYSDNHVTCPPFIINVVNQSKNYKRIFWDFGDGANSDNTTGVTHIYTMGGTYRLRMLVYGYGDGCVDSMVKIIEVKGPSGHTNVLDSIGCSPHTVRFSATSSNAVSYQWDFGDGNVSSPLPTGEINHTYKHDGILQPRLILADRLGCKVSVPTRQKVRIDETKIAPSATLPEICDSTLREFQLEGSIFTRDSLGLPANYQWDFGDPGSADNTSVSANPRHHYAAPGNYTARVHVKTVYGCDVQRVVPITIPKPYVMKVITSPDTVICKGTATTLRAGGAYRYAWSPATGLNDVKSAYPIAMPDTTTTYQVIGYAKGDCQIDTAYTKVAVRELPRAAISTIDTLICPGTSITWVNKSSGNQLTYQWNFGDGNTSIKEIPSNSYRGEGIYTVSLKVKTKIGCQDSMVQKNYIHVGEPHAKWDYADSNASCLPLVVSIKNRSANYRKIQWNFGDGTTSSDTDKVRHAYGIPGTYRLSMLVYGYSTGCMDSLVKLVVVKGPYGKPAIMDSVGCSPFTVRFSAAATNTVSYQWDFGDSTISNPSGTDKITHIYQHGGIFQPRLKLTDKNGCQIVLPTRSKVKVDEINIMPSFTFPDICDSAMRAFQVSGLIFTKDSLNLPVNYQWDFGDPAAVDNTSTSLDPRHHYPGPGSYPVVVNVETAYGCKAKSSLNVMVLRPHIMNVEASSDTIICQGTPAALHASGANRYVWTPASGLNNAESAAPMAIPEATTSYQVVGYSVGDCRSDTANVQIIVKNNPRILLSTDTTISTGSIFPLPVSYSPDAINWSWTPSLYLNCTQCAVPTCSPHQSITYKVVTSNQWGCSDTASINVTLICKEGKVFIPSAFTPNHDGLNDIFYPIGEGVGEVIYFRIYNRWGQLVYERSHFQLNDKSAGWDGTSKGQKLPTGAFVYQTLMQCESGNKFMLSGHVTLIR